MRAFDAFRAIVTPRETAALPTLLSEGLAKTSLGSLQGLVDQLQQGRLARQVQSWLADGPNLPITPGLLRSALSEEDVLQLARHFGIEPNAVIEVLAEHLPTAVEQARRQGIIAAPS